MNQTVPKTRQPYTGMSSGCLLYSSVYTVYPNLSNKMAPADFSGKWVLDKSDNMDAYLAATGRGDKKAPESGIEITVTMDGDNCTILYTDNGFAFKIVPGQVNEFTLPDGHAAKVNPEWQGAALVSTSLDGTHIAKRYMEGDHLVQEFVQDAVVAKRYFKRA